MCTGEKEEAEHATNRMKKVKKMKTEPEENTIRKKKYLPTYCTPQGVE